MCSGILMSGVCALSCLICARLCAVPGPSVFPSGEPGVSGDFWGSQEGCQGPFRTSGRNRGLPLRRHSVRHHWEKGGSQWLSTHGIF